MEIVVFFSVLGARRKFRIKDNVDLLLFSKVLIGNEYMVLEKLDASEEEKIFEKHVDNGLLPLTRSFWYDPKQKSLWRYNSREKKMMKMVRDVDVWLLKNREKKEALWIYKKLRFLGYRNKLMDVLLK